MPFRLKLRRTRRYNVLSKNYFVTRIRLLDSNVIECTLSVESTGQECLEAVAQRLELREVRRRFLIAQLTCSSGCWKCRYFFTCKGQHHVISDKIFGHPCSFNQNNENKRSRLMTSWSSVGSWELLIHLKRWWIMQRLKVFLYLWVNESPCWEQFLLGPPPPKRCRVQVLQLWVRSPPYVSHQLK